MQSNPFGVGKFFDVVISACESLAASRYWRIKGLLLIVLGVLIFHGFPGIRSVITQASETYAAVEIKAQDLTHDLTEDFDPQSNMAKQNFRLVMPIISRIFHLNGVGLYIVQVGFGLGILYLSMLISQRVTNDKVVAILITVLVATIWAGETGFLEVNSRYDAPSIFFLLLAVYSRNPLVIVMSIFLAGWNDERGLIGSSLVFVFHYVVFWLNNKQNNHARFTIYNFVLYSMLAVIAGWVIYLVSRFTYAQVFQVSALSVDILHYLRSNINWFPFGLWTAFEGGWFMVILAFAILMGQKLYVPMLLSAGALIVVLVTALAVVDISRSMAYALPMIFVAIYILNRYIEQGVLRKVVCVSAVVAALWPMYYLEHSLLWITPLPLQPFF